MTWRIIPPLFACYVAVYLDRVNVGFAKLPMLSDLGFSETIYGLGAGIFFIGYFLFEVLAQLKCLPAGAATASDIAVINSVGNPAGFVSPYAIGCIINVAHSTSLGVYTLAGCLMVGSLLCLTMLARLVNC